MWNVAGTREPSDRRVGQHVGELLNHRGERRGALVPRCQERGTMKRPDPCEVEGKLLRIVSFVQKCRRIRDERLLEIGRELISTAAPERHRFDELPGGTGIVA